jgi:hypothetical protein
MVELHRLALVVIIPALVSLIFTRPVITSMLVVMVFVMLVVVSAHVTVFLGRAFSMLPLVLMILFLAHSIAVVVPLDDAAVG